MSVLTVLGAAALATAAGSAYAGNVFLTGHDPDFHATQGPVADGAQSFIQKVVRWGTGAKVNPKILVVTSNDAPAAGAADTVVGIATSLSAPGGPTGGFTITIADGQTHVPGDVAVHGGVTYPVVSLSSVDFAGFDATICGSNFGGTFTQAELSGLIARKADLIAYLNGATNRLLFAMAEGNAQGVPAGSVLDETQIFGYLETPVAQHIDETAYEADYTIAPFGMAPIGFDPSGFEVNGNFSHTFFNEAGGYDVVDLLPGTYDPDTNPTGTLDRIFSLATSKKIDDGGGIDPGSQGGCTFSGCGITLGAAADLTVFQFNHDTHKESLDVHGSTTSIEGNVGVEGGCEIHGNQGTIEGDLELANDSGGATSKLKKFTILGGAPPGTPTSVPLDQAELDAQAASNAAAAEAVTQNLGDVKKDKKKGDLTINSTGACNVIAIKKLDLHDCTFTLNGNPGDVFIINVSDHAELHEVTMALTGGLTGNNVLFNFPGKHGEVHIHESTVYGTWLSQDGHVELEKSTLYGAIQSGEDIHIHDSQIICH